MVITIDIGNTNACIGVYHNDQRILSTRIKTDREKTAMEYAVLLKDVLDVYGVQRSEVAGVALSSVVPVLTTTLTGAIELLFNLKPLVITPAVNTGLILKIDEPASCGADLICTAVGAAEKYPLPAIVIDLGTATKITVIDRERGFCGGAIIPGVMVSLDALGKGTALLPSISVSGKVPVIGTNTVDCMLSGSILGTASMLDGMVERYQKELGEPCTIVACGGLSSTVVPYCCKKMILDQDLLLDGLYAVYQRSCGRS